MHICFDGKILDAGYPVLTADNKGYRYGDGLFETIKMVNGRMPLFKLHMLRLFEGIRLFEYAIPAHFTTEKLEADIITLCNKNGCSALARIRLSVSRGDGGIYEQDRDKMHCLIEAWPASPGSNILNENGLVTGIYPHAKKSTGIFSKTKSANYLPYTMAARFAKQQQWNDCLVLNQNGRLADSTIANVFLVKDNLLFTPSTDEGGVEGVMRKYLLEQAILNGIPVSETVLTIDDMLAADEAFLTNAMNGIRWIARFEKKIFTNKLVQTLHKKIIGPLWA